MAESNQVVNSHESSPPGDRARVLRAVSLPGDGIAKLSIETSNDLFEMDKRVTIEEVYDFRSKRSEWVAAFDAGLRDLFEKRLEGTRRKGRRPDPLQVFDALRVVSDNDASKQSALERVSRRLEEAAKSELDALDWRVSVLFGEAPVATSTIPSGLRTCSIRSG
jgi:hypothetical protein